jgi:8-oxo-dGTP diphosphatase
MRDLFKGKRPTVATDIAVFTVRNKKLYLLLIKRGHEPFKGQWALPGGFMEWGESCEEAAARELEEETALKNVPLELLGVFSKPGRDPRGTVVSVAYIGLVSPETTAQSGDDAADAKWVEIEDCKNLAADHGEMVAKTKKFLLQKKADANWFAPVLSKNFEMKDLERVLKEL